jgi:ribosomal protein S3
MKSVWKTKAVSAKDLLEFNIALERALNDLEENEFKIVKIEDVQLSKWNQHYQTIIIACKNPGFVLGPAGTTIVNKS